MPGVMGDKYDHVIHPILAAVAAYLGVYYLKDVMKVDFMAAQIGNPLLYGILIAAIVGAVYGLVVQKYVKQYV